MSAKYGTRSTLLLSAVAMLTACASHRYGVSVTPRGDTWGATQYLTSQGFKRASVQSGDVLSMERRHGDSVDHVRVLKGGSSPGMWGSASASTTGSSFPGGAGGGIPISAGASQGSSGMFAGGSGSGSSGKLTIEIASYRVDRDGKRHAVEPTTTLFDQADSVITLMTGIPSSRRQ